MDILRNFPTYETAESFADQFKGDTRTDDAVSVVEDFTAAPWERFLVVHGPVDAESLSDDGEKRYEVQYTA